MFNTTLELARRICRAKSRSRRSTTPANRYTLATISNANEEIFIRASSG
jgi:hypothetical protein